MPSRKKVCEAIGMVIARSTCVQLVESTYKKFYHAIRSVLRARWMLHCTYQYPWLE